MTFRVLLHTNLQRLQMCLSFQAFKNATILINIKTCYQYIFKKKSNTLIGKQIEFSFNTEPFSCVHDHAFLYGNQSL